MHVKSLHVRMCENVDFCSSGTIIAGSSMHHQERRRRVLYTRSGFGMCKFLFVSFTTISSISLGMWSHLQGCTQEHIDRHHIIWYILQSQWDLKIIFTINSKNGIEFRARFAPLLRLVLGRDGWRLLSLDSGVLMEGLRGVWEGG